MTREIPLFSAKPSAQQPAVALRLRFLNERMNAKPSMTPAERDAFAKEREAIDADAERIALDKSILRSGTEMLLGFHAELDDSDQPYSLYVPSEYDGSSPFPLVLLLHGQGMFNPLQCRATPLGRMIVAAPQGRGGMDYMYVGEDDVLCVLRHVRQLVNVDANRVYLAGASMGGTGSWHLAAHFPDQFAGIMANCGSTDINVWAELWHWRTPDSPLAAVRQFLREDTSSVTYVPNLHNVNVLALHGEADPIVNQRHAHSMLNILKKEGHTKHAFHLLPYVTHGFGVNYELGLHEFVRDPKPLRVRYKTAWLRYPGAYWLRILGIGRRLKHASIDGTADPRQRTLTIATENVTELSIDSARLPFEHPARIEVDGDVFTSVPQSFKLTASGRWEAIDRIEPRPITFPPRKTAQVEGPAEHAFMTPFTLVTPAPQDSSELAAAARAAAAAYNAQWRTRFAVGCREKSADQLTSADIEQTNLILFGTPETNALIARSIQQLPVQWKADGIGFGGRDYHGANLGLILCYSNPLNPQRYAVLISGTTPRSYAEINVRFGNWFDWIPYDYRKHYDFAIFDDLTCGRHPESFLVWGFFDESWRVDPALTFPAAESFRKTLLPRVFPTLDLAKLSAQPNDDGVFLSDALTTSENFAKENLERNRTLDGGPLQLLGRNYARGLCCRFPCSLTFPTGGYGKFSAVAGVAWDGMTEPCEDRKTFEKVRVTVHADNRLLFEANEQTWRSEPLKIEAELGDAKSITLAANGGLSWLNGSFIWADAELKVGRRQ